MSEFSGNSSQEHVATTTKLMFKIRATMELVQEEEGQELENGEICPTVSDFYHAITGAVSNERVAADFDFPANIADIDKEDTQRLKDVYRVMGGAVIIYGKAAGTAMNYMSALKNMAVVRLLN
jgi:hypothetical protein